MHQGNKSLFMEMMLTHKSSASRGSLQIKRNQKEIMPRTNNIRCNRSQHALSLLLSSLISLFFLLFLPRRLEGNIPQSVKRMARRSYTIASIKMTTRLMAAAHADVMPAEALRTLSSPDENRAYVITGVECKNSKMNQGRFDAYLAHGQAEHNDAKDGQNHNGQHDQQDAKAGENAAQTQRTGKIALPRTRHGVVVVCNAMKSRPLQKSSKREGGRGVRQSPLKTTSKVLPVARAAEARGRPTRTRWCSTAASRTQA